MFPLLALDDEARLPSVMEPDRAQTVRGHEIEGIGQIGSSATGLPHQFQRLPVDFTRRVQVGEGLAREGREGEILNN